MLIHVDYVDGCHHSWPVQSEDPQTENDAGLVAENCPAEMNVCVEQDEASDADGDENESGGHR